jgi:hypothetical protein
LQHPQGTNSAVLALIGLHAANFRDLWLRHEDAFRGLLMRPSVCVTFLLDRDREVGLNQQSVGVGDVVQPAAQGVVVPRIRVFSQAVTARTSS